METDKLKLLKQVIETAPKDFEVTLTVETLKEFIEEYYEMDNFVIPGNEDSYPNIKSKELLGETFEDTIYK